MSDGSKIEWTEATWNPVTGCTKVSPGCDHCYAETFAERWRGVPGHHFERGFDVTLRPERLTQPLHWKRPRRVFVNSMSDLFHEAVPDEYIVAVFGTMAQTPQHTYQVLTKRHGRMRSLLGGGMFRQRFAFGWPLPNVWLGVSVEDQKWADIRIPALLRTPAAVRFLSCEPLLGPVDLKRSVWTMGSERGHGLTASFVHAGGCCDRFHGIDWVIAGGESGPGARPMVPAWARSLRDQCTDAGVPFFFKQWGAHRWVAHSVYDDATQCWVERGIEPQRVSKKLAGRLLDGREWNEFPAAAERTAA
jgi:protein gp37